ncbi:Kinesin heavy chain [Strongyloides ratti]|uniref:Kinesin-like protein n=1 Tax=Strongyloides ratti TaxID=34506 RepID=A0A090MXN0_STRRB|nr:Kinesin heavy chain [Strongyloides ratti]CEF65719.1 Kinesin heavy chain [Strongyloides ratti]
MKYIKRMAQHQPPSECCIQVCCRIRPLNETEKKNGYQFIPKFPSKESIIVGGKTYNFDRVFDPSCNQQQVYEGSAYHIVQDVLSGYNGTVFAYGQTSSGKTHTMEGIIGDSEKQGIIPRIINDIFTHIYNMDEPDLEFVLKVSYFEIYNEKIRDLFDVSKTNLAIHEDKNRIPYVKGATEQFVSTPEEVLQAIEEGKNNRMVAVTNMNEHSSRSHSVFLITVNQENKNTNKKLSGKLYLVDLAGSEKVSKTGAEGMVLEEAKNINKSLSALGNVIAALAEGTKSHVPYRDSKLTRILQESLGGNSRTTIVICASPASFNEGETKSTLLFGQRAKTIKNVVVVNEELSAEEWKRRYERERDKVSRLKNHLLLVEAELKRWRSGEKVPESEWTQILGGDIVQMGDIGNSSLTPSISDSMMASMDRSIMNAKVIGSGDTGPITDEERRKYEEERSKLYQQLDDKDDEIQQHSQIAARLQQQISEQDDLIKNLRADYESVLSELALTQTENDTSKGECKEVMEALEEVVLSLEQKKAEVDHKVKENENLSEELNKKTLQIIELNSKMDEIKEQADIQRKKIQEHFQNMIRELQESGDDSIVLKDLENQATDELLTHTRLAITKLTSDFKAAQIKVSSLETGSDDVAKKVEQYEKELSEIKINLQQHEIKNKSLNEKCDELEKAKRALEETVDSLNATLASASTSSSSGVVNEEAKEQHQKLVAQLRDQLAERNNELVNVQDELKNLQVVKDQLQADFDKLKHEENEKENIIKNMSTMGDRKEKALQSLRSLQGAMGKELSSLSNLRKFFAQDMLMKTKKGPMAPDGEEEYYSPVAQKQKIIFLENNLDQLTKVHKQLVRDNADLRYELPKLEKRLRASMERIKTLEMALKETKENAMKDRKRYQMEVERIKEAVRQRNLARRGIAPNIAKPIRPGQHYPSQPSIVRTNTSNNNVPGSGM